MAMQKKLCPFCDHEIKGRGKCDFCGSWVTKPVIAEASAEFHAEIFANPDKYDRNMDAPETYSHNDTYRDNEDISYQTDYGQTYGSGLSQSAAANAASAGAVDPNAATYSSESAPRRAVLASEMINSRQTNSAQVQNSAPRRAVLASEAVERGQTTVRGGSKTVVKVVVIVIIFNIIMQILLTVFNL